MADTVSLTLPALSPVLRRASGGTWVAQSVDCPTLAQVMISQFLGSSPAWGSVLTAWSLEPTLDSVSPSFSAPPLLVLSSLSLSQNYTLKKKKNQKASFHEAEGLGTLLLAPYSSLKCLSSSTL